MPGGKSKTVVYPFDEAINYTNEGKNYDAVTKDGFFFMKPTRTPTKIRLYTVQCTVA